MLDFIDELVSKSSVLKRKVAEETLIQDAVEAIWEAMEVEGVTKSYIAEQLGTSPANVTQALRGTRNMTLRNLAGFAYALKRKVKIKLVDEIEIEIEESNWRVVCDAAVRARPSSFWSGEAVIRSGCANKDSYEFIRMENINTVACNG